MAGDLTVEHRHQSTRIDTSRHAFVAVGEEVQRLQVVAGIGQMVQLPAPPPFDALRSFGILGAPWLHLSSGRPDPRGSVGYAARR